MNLTTSTLDSLESWVTTTRQLSTQLEYQADSLLVNLQRLKARARRIAALKQQPLTLGFYGYAQAGKNALMTALQSHPNERIEIVLGDKSLDYLTHINPGDTPTLIAVRFSQTPPPEQAHFPLRLALFTECELAHQFILSYQQQSTPRVLAPSLVSQRLGELEERALPESVATLNPDDVALLLLEYRRLQRREGRFDAALERRISLLAPRLSLNDRAELFSLLWGEDMPLTQQWLHLAGLLQQLGNPQQVLAPASLVVDSFMLPAEGFLTPANPHSAYQPTDVLVCSVINGVSRAPLSIAQQDLALICAEVILTQKPGATLSDVDLIDIPRQQLAYYHRRLQPDILLVCNAVNSVDEIQTTGQALSQWVDNTQITGAGHLPGLIWAITASDSRFKSGLHLDEGVQRRVGQAQTRWGALQAQDSRNMHLLHEWIAGALTPERKAQRQAGLTAALKHQTQQLFQGITEAGLLTPQQEKERAETLVRALQVHALQLGSMQACLLPSREALQQCWLLSQQQETLNSDDPGLNIDLFADETQDTQVSQETFSYAKAVHRLWINHLQAPLQPSEASPAIEVEPALWRSLCDILISASYRLDLPELLETVTADCSRFQAVARSYTVLGDFVAWLGYATTAYSQRPLSRINKQQPIFAPPPPVDIHQRLSKLGEQPQRANASYAYDWLVALYTRATENVGYQSPQQISPKQQQLLLKILAGPVSKPRVKKTA